MEKKDRNINLSAVIIIGILSFVSVLWLFIVLITKDLDIPHNIEIVTDILAVLIAYAYLISGYTKGIANNYRTCMILSAINATAVAIISTTESIKVLPLASCIIAIFLLLALAFIKNMGKIVSYIICGLLLFIRGNGLVSVLLTSKLGINDPQISMIVSQICLALTITVITYAKYKDKASRGTN